MYRLILDIIEGDGKPSRSNTSTSVVAERIASSHGSYEMIHSDKDVK